MVAEKCKLNLLLRLLLLLLHLLLKLLIVSLDARQLLLHLDDEGRHLGVLCAKGVGGVRDGWVSVVLLVSGRVGDRVVSRCGCRTSGRRRRCCRA